MHKVCMHSQLYCFTQTLLWQQESGKGDWRGESCTCSHMVAATALVSTTWTSIAVTAVELHEPELSSMVSMPSCVYTTQDAEYVQSKLHILHK